MHRSASERRVTPEVEPGYLRPMLPEDAPETGEAWDSIMNDVDRVIMPGITHWQHPRFHAYFPAGNSYPSILAEILSAGLGIVGFSWAASPACTELEPVMLDWLGKQSCGSSHSLSCARLGRMMSLPPAFLSDPSTKDEDKKIVEPTSECELESSGGGVLLVC